MTNASGNGSMAAGELTKATGERSMAVGIGTNSRSFGSLALGRFNDSIATSTKTSWVATDPVFIIGNGTSDANRSNALTVYKMERFSFRTSSLHPRITAINFMY
ncbi:MAG: hypothetical protein IPN10_01595 [Saprospiraceae bacterium]|nr:hypothetical protein [Saprospiraceae bacterium]